MAPKLPKEQLIHLKVVNKYGTMQAYHYSFNELANSLILSKPNLLSCYVGGLEYDIQLSECSHPPQASCVAKLQEASIKVKKPIPILI